MAHSIDRFPTVDVFNTTPAGIAMNDPSAETSNMTRDIVRDNDQVEHCTTVKGAVRNHGKLGIGLNCYVQEPGTKGKTGLTNGGH
jgi:hypothetical protein